ncbi:MAG: ORF6N domain-containing protein [Candidatus Acidiferrum sp.]
MPKTALIVPAQRVESLILLIRGKKVMLDSDLAHLYGVTTKALNQAVKRNRGRFPADFTFRLTRRERTQLVTTCDHLRKLKYSASLPYAFSEHGAVMLASVLNSPVAVQASIQVVRAFVKLREFLGTQHKLALKLLELEKRLGDNDHEITTLFEAIRQLMQPPAKPAKRIGFHI